MKTSTYAPTYQVALAILAGLSASISFAADDPVRSSTRAGENAADSASSRIEDYRSENSDVNKAEVKASFDLIDAELAHLENLINSAPSKTEKSDAKNRYNALKERRDQLKRSYNRARYEALKNDIKSEVERVSEWAKQTFSSQPAASSAVNTASGSAEKAAEKIGDYRTDASDINKAEVKAAIARLDADIDLLEARIETVADAQRKAQLKTRLQSIKERRDELAREFRKARYDALTADVKAEWNRLTD